MKPLVCQSCGSNEFVEENDFYKCRYCNTKYPVEKAGIITESDKLSNLYVLARSAAEDENDDEAYQYYKEILLIEPNDWEAVFYSAYCGLRTRKIVDFYAYVDSFIASVRRACRLIHALSSRKKERAVSLVFTLTVRLFFTVNASIVSLQPAHGLWRNNNYSVERNKRSAVLMMINLGDIFMEELGDRDRAVYYYELIYPNSVLADYENAVLLNKITAIKPDYKPKK